MQLADDAAVRRRLLPRARRRRRPCLGRVRRAPEEPLPAPPRRDAGRAAGALRWARKLDKAAGRPVHLGDVRRDRHDRSAGARTGCGVRARSIGIHGRGQRRELDAAELRGGARRGHSRGHPPDREDHGPGHRPARDVDRIAIDRIAAWVFVNRIPPGGRVTSSPDESEPAAAVDDRSDLADVVALPRRDGSDAARRRQNR